MHDCRDYSNRYSCCDCRPRPCPPRPSRCCCVGPAGPQGPQGLSGPFQSSYVEALGAAQTVANGAHIVFDIDPREIDLVGTDIMVDRTGTIFTLTRPGLYHVEWSVNVGTGTAPLLLCLMENGEANSPLHNSVVSGNYSSGALINVVTAPYTVSLHNFGGPISLVDPVGFANTAASIRILRFADGARMV